MDAIYNVSRTLYYLLFELDPKPDYKYFYFLFNNGIFTDIKYISEEKGTADVQNSVSTIENLSVDLTLSLLFLNIYEIADQSSNTSNDISVAVKFLKKYIAPKELAEVKLVNGAKQTNQECWDDIKSDLAKQAKKRKEKATKSVTEPVKNSVETIKKETKEDEFKKIIEDTQKAFNTKLAAGALSYKSIKWDQIIFQVTACIKDKESREFAEKALQWLKNYDTSKSLLCQIPRFQIPQFPEIKIPEIPSLRSIFSVAAESEADLLLAARDELIKSMLQSLLELSGFCDAPPPSDKPGDTPAEGMMENTDASANKTPDLNDQAQQNQRQDQFLKANVFDNEENIDAKTYETRLLLSKVSEGLTKRELIFLFNGSVGNAQYDIVKNIIEALNSDNKIPNIYSSVNTKLRALNFFSRFGKLIRPDVYQSLTVQEPVNTSYNTRFLCSDQTDYESSLIDDLLKRGLSEEQAAAEIYKRRDDLRKLVDNFTKTVDLLNKQEIKVQPANCTKNPDGSTTPGSTTKAGLPDPILRLNEKANDELFIGFEKAYNEEIKTFANSVSELSYEVSGTAVISKTKFLKSPLEKIVSNLELQAISENSYSTAINAEFAPYNKGDETEEKFPNKSAFQYYTIFNSSNQIRFTTNISYITESSAIVSSSINISLNSVAQKEFPSEIPNEEQASLIDQLSFNGSYTTSSAVSTDYTSNLENNDLQFRGYLTDGYVKYLSGAPKESLFLQEHQFPSYGAVYINNYINNYVFDVPYTNVDRKNKVKDYRLINNITDNKKKILDSVNEPCNVPEVNSDGTKKLSNSDKNTISAAYDVLLRLYAVEYSLFSIPFFEYIEYIQSSIFVYACYASFVQDVKNIYGKEFIDNMFVFLGNKYKEEKGLETIDVTSEQIRFDIFKNSFEEKHLKVVNKQIKDYSFGNNKDNADYRSVQKSNKKFNLLYINSIFGKNWVYDSTPDGEELLGPSDKLTINKALEKYTKVSEVKTIPNYEFFKSVYKYLNGFTPLNYKENAYDISTYNPLHVVVKAVDSIEQTRIINGTSFSAGTDEKYFLTVDIVYYTSFAPPPPEPPPRPSNADEGVRARAEPPPPPTTVTVFSKEISASSVSELINKKEFIPELKEAQKAYSDIFTYSLSLDCIYSNFISSFLLSVTSVRAYNNSFTECKNQLASVFNVLQKANDYKFDNKEDIFAYIKTMVKLGVKASLGTAKAIAKQTDPNAAASFKISEAYDLVFGLASSFKIDKYLPVKHIPAYIPSAVLSNIIPPLSPIAAVAIGSTINDDVLNGGGSSTASDAAKRNK